MGFNRCLFLRFFLLQRTKKAKQSSSISDHNLMVLLELKQLILEIEGFVYTMKYSKKKPLFTYYNYSID
ncbi:hypothetical protein L6452_00400 [Arctium lappa]|uniref:Uncharacterized protein n=1 Tax=Arctium lappa TaxID=4217 RepID=A0ACB9FDA9_ARCLA|nr:hypothetical protein L6452_00400 [Arctium lappa]